MKFERVTHEDVLKRLPLREFHVWWLNVKQIDVDEFGSCLEKATKEEDMQKFLQEKPMVLVQLLQGGQGRWVIPKQKLGSEHITDFIIGDRNSLGFKWTAVELESPLLDPFNKNGDISRHLNHAIRQVSDWRNWLKSNQNYASRSREENGLGLTDIDSGIPGLVIIGRRERLDKKTNKLRNELGERFNIEIHTYDFLLEVAQHQADTYSRQRSW